MPNTIQFNRNYPDITHSLELLAKAKKIMYPVSQTLAKAPGQFSEGVCPVFVESAKGNRITDVDGNEYLDYYAAIGPISLGYGYEKVNEAIKAQLDKGITFSLMHRLEYEICELLHEIIPNAESVRISKSGADVCSAAIRVARAFTARNKVLCCGYHGWHDWYIGTTTRNYGIPVTTSELTQTFKFNDFDDIKSKLDADVAAVILEPFVFEAPNDGYLESLLQMCRDNGTLLIFDEMWTGFRIALGGAQSYFGVIPDLAVYSKAVANGMPIAFLTGRDDVMKWFEKDVFFFTTFGGEALSIAAAIATIQELIEKNVFQHLDHVGTILKDGLNDLINQHGLQEYMICSGYPCRTILSLKPAVQNPLSVYAYIQQELLKCGILWSKFHNMTYAFTEEDIEYTLKAYDYILPLVKDRIMANDTEKYLKGKPMDVVFRPVKF
ncbi:MAG: aminotransferase class III-fold pyridoxal phosphate-dependent enzyme [Saprospiraceae bacterium]|nr:aminotransferase class III-fold pyridoxal phosphate-dependent enzyme [Saprospiraceae bacterium]